MTGRGTRPPASGRGPTPVRTAYASRTISPKTSPIGGCSMVTTLGRMPSLEQLGSEKYVQLTTFRRDGRAVPTPIWVMPDGDGVAFWTVRDSGKVKRIRNSGRVTIA